MVCSQWHRKDCHGNMHVAINACLLSAQHTARCCGPSQARRRCVSTAHFKQASAVLAWMSPCLGTRAHIRTCSGKKHLVRPGTCSLVLVLSRGGYRANPWHALAWTDGLSTLAVHVLHAEPLTHLMMHSRWLLRRAATRCIRYLNPDLLKPPVDPMYPRTSGSIATAMPPQRASPIAM
jgi:hypothetical protein